MASATLLQSSISFIRSYFVFVFPAILIAYLLSNRCQKGLERIPGPWIQSVSTLPRMWEIWKGHSHLHDIKLHEKYGKIVRVAPNIISLADTAEINQLYGISTKFIKSPFYELAAVEDEEGIVPDPFILTNKPLHSRMKKNAANAYSMNGLTQMEPWLEPVTQRLFRYLDGFADSHVCNIGDVLKNYAMDAVFAITFGKDFNFIEKGDTLGFYRTLDIFTDYMAIFGQLAWTHKYLLKNPALAGWVVGDDSSQFKMATLAKDEVEAGRETATEEGPMTFLQRLLLNQKANPDSLTDREINTHAFGNISAGSDTTAIAMRSTLYYLLKYPAVYQKLCQEVRENLTLQVSFAKANELPYLTAVIREAMRMHPSVGMILGRIVPPAGAIISGYKLAAGTEIGMSPWVLHRDPEVFPDPNTFRPERWLASETDKEYLKIMNRSFFAFGHGAHTCSGRWISIMETTKLIPSLLLRYDFAFADSGKGFQFKNRWFTPQWGLNVWVKKRKI